MVCGCEADICRTPVCIFEDYSGLSDSIVALYHAAMQAWFLCEANLAFELPQFAFASDLASGLFFAGVLFSDSGFCGGYKLDYLRM